MGYRNRKNQRGAALFAVAVFLGLLLGMAAIGIDIGRLAHVANEVQTVADAAARGGAKALSDAGGTPGVGITRAKNIGNRNAVNGTLEPANDVLADEGFYDVIDNEFQCCTQNTPCCSGGSWGGFTCAAAANCAKRIAVLAMPRTQVRNLLAGIFDFFDNGQLTANAAAGTPNANTDVQKLAVATVSGPSSGCQKPEGCSQGDWACYCNHGVAPCLPMAAPSCEFPPGCSGTSCQLPNLQVSSNGTDTAGWTGFGLGHSDTIIRSFMNSGPCRPNGQTRVIPEETINSPDLDLTNGISSNGTNNVFDLARCMAGLGPAPQNQPQGCALDANGNIISGQRGPYFTIPIFESASPTCTGNFNVSAPVVGFATIRITAVSSTSPRTISIQTVSNHTGTQTNVGGGCFGTDCRVAMVR